MQLFTIPTAAALAVALAAPAAADEYFTLFASGDWEVGYYEPDEQGREAYCTAATLTELGYFSLDTFANPGLFFYLINDERDWGVVESGFIVAKIDGHNPWNIAISANGGIIKGEIYDGRLLDQIAEGRALLFDYQGDGVWDEQFSLWGSSEAIEQLANCRSRLGGLAPGKEG